MQLDCRNLECPEPVIRTKNAIEGLKDGEELEILVNSLAPRENISRFLKNQNQKFSLSDLANGETLIKTVKNGEISDVNLDEYSCEIVSKKPGKVIYLNEDRTGSGPVGETLLSKFLGAFMQVETKPYAVLLVNNAVKMTTDRGHVSFKVLKDLENAGVKILSCGSCLEAYRLVDKLAIGEITNAFEVSDLLSRFDTIKL
ncbi:sulfurtransferase-like selenium metabolism protein YedF [Campylobacter sp. RM9328]|uniref:sulfurtransferase-like selenium metabolism protein YedF n=1 Tax=Campylobacter sp. RM9328 TaxID=1705720 RepID=UPI001475952E|nr:sulfurtransferase-like selenium metabolism protein YedF [Campylobacter sp. RM9328]